MKAVFGYLVLLIVGIGIAGTVTAAPPGPEYSATISFPNGCLANGVLGEITWDHTSKLKAVEATLTITGPVSIPPPELRLPLKGRDKNSGAMSLFLDVSTDPNHGVWLVTGRLLDENGVSLGKEWNSSPGLACNT